jgi:hypothetical protein
VSATWQWAKANPDAAARRIRDLERENATLRADLLIEEERSIYWRDNEGKAMAENAALWADKERLDWLFTHDGGMWLYWAIDRDWTPERSASRAAIDAARKEAQP